MKKCLELKQNVIIHVILSNSSLFACTTTQTWSLYKGLLIKRCTLLVLFQYSCQKFQFISVTNHKFLPTIRIADHFTPS